MPRVDIRFDPEHKRKLEAVAEAMGVTASEAIRRLVDEAYDEVAARRRRAAVERLGKLATHDPGDPDSLCRQLEQAHGPGVR
jgi:predicted transcriptional regulator